MRDKNRVVKVLFQKMLEYCNDIEESMNQVKATYEVYLSNKMFRYSCDMCVLQIGELTTRFSDEFKAQHSEIPWHAIKAVRNIYVHEYEKIDSERIWKILTKNIPELKAQLEKILAEAE